MDPEDAERELIATQLDAALAVVGGLSNFIGDRPPEQLEPEPVRLHPAAVAIARDALRKAS